MTDLSAAAVASHSADAMPGLFSVDADAHLRKLAACMFPSPAQLPVELVRAALARGARTVAVTIKRRRLAIADDGAGIDAALWRELEHAFDPSLDAAAREAAIAALQRAAATGIGLLAVFVPGAVAIRIESVLPDGARALEIVGGKARSVHVRTVAPGTRIAVIRHGALADSEKRLLRELCASAPAAITINGRVLGKKPILRRCLVRQRTEIGSEKKPAWVAIPVRGDACRIWLLDQQIPWQAYASSSYQGLVFEAALEAAALPAAEEFRQLAEAAHGLYLWLAERYPSFPVPYQERIEELVFNRAKASSDLRLLSSFSPFRLWSSKQKLNLDEVKRLVEKHPLVALPLAGDAGRRLQRHQQALQLSTRQRDFLLNHLRLPLLEPEAAMDGPGRAARLSSRLGHLASKLAILLPRLPVRALAPTALTAEERKLCRELESVWRKRLHAAHNTPLAVSLAKGRGLAPALLKQGPLGSELLLRRRHPLVAAAVRRVAADSANAELAFAALAPLPLLTPGCP